MKEKNISIGIIAGGRSRRMGKDKAFLKIKGRYVIDSIIDKFRAFGEIIISDSGKGRFEDRGCKVVYDKNEGIGPLEGVRRILEEASSEYVFVCAVDMPFIDATAAEYMAEFISSDCDCYIASDSDRIHPLCAIYKKSVLTVIEDLINSGERKLSAIFERAKTKYVSFEYLRNSGKLLTNVNTPGDFFNALKPFVFSVSGLSGSGKTTLMTKLVKSLSDKGYKVCCIKHDGCDKYTDLPGSDTYRYSDSGAICSAVFTDTRFMVDIKQKKSSDEIVELVSENCPDADFIIIEGLKASSYPKIEVVGESGKSGLCARDTLICEVTAEGVNNDASGDKDESGQIYDREDIAGIIRCIRDYLRRETGCALL